MEFLTEQALQQLKYGLSQSKADFGLCVNQAVPWDLLHRSPVRLFTYYQQHFVIKKPEYNYIQGELMQLPFLTDSVDVIVVWHNLDFNESLDCIVKEFWRALAPNGLLFIIGANSPCFFSDTIKNPKKSINKRSLVTRLLTRTGFRIDVEKTFGFVPKHVSPKKTHWLKPIEVIGQFCWPMWGSRYYIEARKPVLGLIEPLKIKQRKLMVQPKGIAQPTGRVCLLDDRELK